MALIQGIEVGSNGIKKPVNPYSNIFFNKNPAASILPNKPTPPKTPAYSPAGATAGTASSNLYTSTPKEESVDTGGSGGSGGGSTYNPYSSLLAQLEAEKRRQEALQREQMGHAKNAYESLLDQIGGAYKYGEGVLNQSTDNALSQSYIAHEQAKKMLPQQLAAYGSTGGMTESAMLGQQANYQSGRNNIETEKLAKLAELLQQRQLSETQAEQGYQNTVMGIKNNASNAIGNLESQYASNLANMEAAAQKAALEKKPSISLDDALSLKKQGVESDKINAALLYHLGNYTMDDSTEKAKVAPAINFTSQNAKNVANSLESHIASMTPAQKEQQMKSFAQNALAQQQMTPQEIEEVLKYFGYAL